MSTTAPTPTPTTLVSIRMPVEMKERFEWMAQVMKRSRTHVFMEALQRYLDHEQWQLKDILDAMDEAAQEEGIPHDEAMRNAGAIVERARMARKTQSEGQ